MCEHECDMPEFEFDTADGYAPANQYDKATGERLRSSWGENGWERRGEVKPFCNETAENCVADCHCGDGTCEAARGEGVLKPQPQPQPQPPPSPQCLMPNAQCPMLNAQCPIPNAQCPMPNAPTLSLILTLSPIRREPNQLRVRLLLWRWPLRSAVRELAQLQPGLYGAHLWQRRVRVHARRAVGVGALLLR